MKVAVLHVGTSMLAPLARAEREINKRYDLGLRLACYNCGVALTEDEWQRAERDIAESELVFVIHVTDGENAGRIRASLIEHRERHRAVVAFNCMPDLMRCTRMGKLEFDKLMRSKGGRAERQAGAKMVRRIASLMGDLARSRRGGEKDQARGNGRGHLGRYVKLISRLPAVLRFVPGAGRVGDLKNYLYLFCYFLQPTPDNIRSMVLFAIKEYHPAVSRRIKVDPPEAMPAVAIYHPDAPGLFETFAAYEKWRGRSNRPKLRPDATVGLLLMRPQIVSRTRRHYDELIRAIEREGLEVIPAISTFMDNRESCRRFFVEPVNPAKDGRGLRPRVSQVLSLTGFSFVGGPATNDSGAAVKFLSDLNVPFRSMVSLDVQTIENWEDSKTGLNPVQTAMQVAIPEIDGATEPFIYGGMPATGEEPDPLPERCSRIARRLARWRRLQAAARSEVRVACLVFCFPPDKGNIGTAADLDVFPSVIEILERLKREGYSVEVPNGPERLRDMLLGGNSPEFGTVANVAYRMGVDEYRRLCPYVDEVEREWGRAPGRINSNGREILIQGLELGNVFVGIQPTFGYEGDPMRLLAAESATPHHGFAAFYTYLEKVFGADAVVHVGTHGAMEFMPGKQVGLSSSCWPDRLIGELPNLYLYSVNNPSEGTIAKRRSYAELVSYLTPPLANAGLYRELTALKDLLTAYRSADDDAARGQLYEAIDEKATALNLWDKEPA